ncbi:MAG: RdgB/HAM1 family non-canonical purine NTP pyrophosphatase [Gammaproteobacteria bacterium]|jgi:XTP/dITP diphosphohydrolase|nr:RdgB/HAM1 family non-canonical purine NTP pyrophosphatase [Gammaproteobacteria bacterium]
MSEIDRKQFVLASGNQGKLREIAAILAATGLDLRAQSEWQLEEAEETGLTFVENALIKARHAAEQTGLMAIADDSGIEVDALQGAPGIYSARYAGPDCDTSDNNNKLLAALDGVVTEQRSARFQCVIVAMRHALDPTPLICSGRWEGRIMQQPSGDAGFGYDPIFWVNSEHCAAAELATEQKNRISHRAQALQQLQALLPTWLSQT